MQTKSILISGVGGQGVILASDILSEVLFQTGYDVKKNEIHGMSQREGAVVSHIRFGDKVYSPMINENEADFLLSFEKLEAARNVGFLKPNGVAIVNELEIPPVPVILGVAEYPKNVKEILNSKTEHVMMIKSLDIAKEVGNAKVINIVLIGALSKYLTEIPKENWIAAIKSTVKPQFVEVNLLAFEKGASVG